MNTHRTLAFGASILTAAGLVLLTPLPLSAAIGTWTGGGLTTDWSDAGNWSGGVIPGSTSVTNNVDSAIFNGSTGLIVTPDAGRNLRTFTFSSANLGSFTIGSTGGNALLLTSATTFNILADAPSGVTQTINAPLNMYGGMSIVNQQTSGNSALVFGGSIESKATSGTQTISVILGNANSSSTASGNNHISGNISDGSTGGKIAIAAATYGQALAGGGVLTLSGNNTFSGGVNWTQSGGLNLNSTTALGTGAFTITSGGMLDNTSGQAISLTSGSPITINAGFYFRGSNDLNLGNGAVSLGSGSGATRIIRLDAGDLRFDGDVSDGSVGKGFQLIGFGSLAGSLTLAGNNSFSGGINVGDVTLNINSATAIGTGTLITGNTARLDNTSGSALTLSSNNAQTWGSFTFIGSNDLDLGTGAVAANGAKTLTIQNKKLTVGGVISIGTFTLTKEGSGTLALTAANTYLGKTQVNAGTLLINGTHIDSSNAGVGYGNAAQGHFQVASGGVIGGTGRIAGNTALNNSNMVLVESGGFFAPGASIGTMVLDGANIGGTNSRVLNMAAGSAFNFELAGNGGVSDELHFWNYSSGDLLLNNNAINLTLSGSVMAGTYTVSLFEFYSDSGATLTAGGIATGLTIGTLDPLITGTPTLNFNSGGNTIDLTYTVVPEPGTWTLVVAGLAVLAFVRRGRPFHKTGLGSVTDQKACF